MINVPKQGIGKHDSALHRCSQPARHSLWDVERRSGTFLGESARGLLQFCELINDLKQRIHDTPPSELIQQVMEKSGYVSELIAEGTDEAEERRRNLQGGERRSAIPGGK